jgi:hypothetical protein
MWGLRNRIRLHGRHSARRSLGPLLSKRILGSGSRHFFVAGYALDARLMTFWKGLNSQQSYSPFVCLLTSIWLKLRNVLTYSMIRARLLAAR